MAPISEVESSQTADTTTGSDEREERDPSSSGPAPQSSTSAPTAAAKTDNLPRRPDGSVDIEAVISKSSSFDDKWENFQIRFDAAMKSSIAKIAEALGATNVSLDENEQGKREFSMREGALSDAERAAVLPGGISLPEVARGISAGRFQNVVVMAGAGISVSAGIPDFRTPGTGLYDNLAKYNLPTPQSVFDIGFFQSDEAGEGPWAFYSLAKEMWPGQYRPTPTHHFIKLLHEKGLLLRCYTQNIDGLERLAGVPAEALVEAHGTFNSAHCCACGAEVPCSALKARIMQDPLNVPKCAECRAGLVKPDIVFFGEPLPDRFQEKMKTDFASDYAPAAAKAADLLIVLGTSLAVQPFAGLITRVGPAVPRVLINREAVGEDQFGGFRFSLEDNYRDVLCLGDCDSEVAKLAEMLGWGDALIEKQTKYVAPEQSDHSEPDDGLRRLPQTATYDPGSRMWLFEDEGPSFTSSLS